MSLQAFLAVPPPSGFKKAYIPHRARILKKKKRSVREKIKIHINNYSSDTSVVANALPLLSSSTLTQVSVYSDPCSISASDTCIVDDDDDHHHIKIDHIVYDNDHLDQHLDDHPTDHIVFVDGYYRNDINVQESSLHSYILTDNMSNTDNTGNIVLPQPPSIEPPRNAQDMQQNVIITDDNDDDDDDDDDVPVLDAIVPSTIEFPGSMGDICELCQLPRGHPHHSSQPVDCSEFPIKQTVSQSPELEEDAWNNVHTYKEIHKLCTRYLNLKQAQQNTPFLKHHAIQQQFYNGLHRLSQTSLLAAQFGLITGVLCKPPVVSHLSALEFHAIQPGHLFRTRPQSFDQDASDYWISCVRLLSNDGKNLDQVLMALNRSNNNDIIDISARDMKKMFKGLLQQQRNGKRHLKLFIKKIKTIKKQQRFLTMKDIMSILLDMYYMYFYDTDHITAAAAAEASAQEERERSRQLIQLHNGALNIDVSAWWNKKVEELKCLFETSKSDAALVRRSAEYVRGLRGRNHRFVGANSQDTITEICMTIKNYHAPTGKVRVDDHANSATLEAMSGHNIDYQSSDYHAPTGEVLVDDHADSAVLEAMRGHNINYQYANTHNQYKKIDHSKRNFIKL
jgi:hypothetical protein